MALTQLHKVKIFKLLSNEQLNEIENISYDDLSARFHWMERKFRLNGQFVYYNSKSFSFDYRSSSKFFYTILHK